MTVLRNVIHGVADTRLAPRIAAVLVVKVIGLAVIWLLFVRDQRVAVDARATSAAFGLAAPASDLNLKPEGQFRGQ